MSVNEAALHFERAESLKAQGRFTEAEAVYRLALNVEPTSAGLWWALGDLYARTENFPGVEMCCRQILTASPGIPEVHLYLGMALQRQAKLEAAESELLKASALNAELADVRFQLGIVQQALGKTALAIESYQAALGTMQNPGPALYNLSLLHQEQRHVEAAFRYAFDAVQAQPDSLKYAQLFVRLLNAVCPTEADAPLLARILRCFDMRGLDIAPLMKPCLTLLAGDHDIRRAIELVLREPQRNFPTGAAQDVFARLFENELLYKLLLHTKIASSEMEILLCALRRFALMAAIDTPLKSPVVALSFESRFAEALACQFFYTEYATYVDREEAAAVETLAGQLIASMRGGGASSSALARRIATYCMYRPLSSLNGVEQVVGGTGCALASALPLIVERQWSDYCAEQVLKRRIRALTPISVGVSEAVKSQYEESPYPRWLSVDLYEPESLRTFLNRNLPHFVASDWCDRPIDVLIAGCGTGHHAIMLAAALEHSTLLAVDLSRSSLAYAMRKADTAGLTSIQFAQADILELESLGRRFHIAESVGVLHHMHDPLLGLRIVSGMLVDNGLMRLGFYSALGRRAVAAARQYIADQGFASTPEDIRAARKALRALDTGHPAYPVIRLLDFYALSECRDLLFHVQEHCLTLQELAGMLAECGLRFLGFTFNDDETGARYREHFPDDPDMIDLAHWHEFEQMYPDTFEAMYQFWCQKT